MNFPSTAWLHDAVISVLTVGVIAFATTWLATPVLNVDAAKAAWFAAIAAGARALVALLSGFINGTSSVKPHAVELATPAPK